MTGSRDTGENSVQQDLFNSDQSHTEDERTGRHAVMHCDGASSGNPGHSGIGVVISLHNKGKAKEGDVVTISRYIGTATNNVAEYSALIAGLEKARSLGVDDIEIYLDSELIVKQVTGLYKVKNKNLMPLWATATSLFKKFKKYRVTHVRREYNKEADALATQAVKQNTAI